MNDMPDLPALNWFVHVLSENVGYVTWDGPIGPHGGNMPVRHPIPEGKDIVLKDSKTYSLNCDSVYTRNLVIELAKRYKDIENENFRIKEENEADHWNLASELPNYVTSPYSSRRFLSCLVTSPVLRYICYNGVCMGFYDGHEKAWFIEINGKRIRHDEVTHWRHIPPSPEKSTKYEEVKDKVEQLRKEIE